MQLRTRQFFALLTIFAFAISVSTACGDDGGEGENGANGNNGVNGDNGDNGDNGSEVVGAGYTGCDGLPDVDDMAEGPELDESYLTDGVYEVFNIETAARIQSVEVIPGTLRITNESIEPEEQLECLELPNLKVVEGSILGRHQTVGVGGGTLPEEITFESLTTVGEDFSFANLRDALQRIDAPALTATNTDTDPTDHVQGAYFVNNEGLVEVSMPNLEEVFHLSVQENPVLETLDVSSLNEVSSWVQIVENPSFSSCEAHGIADEVGSPPAVEVCDNYDDGCHEPCDS